MHFRLAKPLARYFSTNLLRLSKNSLSSNYMYKLATTVPIFSFAYYVYLPGNLNNKEQQKQLNKTLNQPIIDYKIPEKTSLFNRLWKYISHVARFFQLLLIFMPSILLSPLLIFKRTQHIWMDAFVKAIQRSGVVFIKAFQYLSHRRDIIGPQLAEKFQYLREKAPTHSFQTTEQYFKDNYGCKIQQIFDEFDNEPIASGSVSQVYKAIYKGHKVAVKVRHPNVDKHIQRDINLLFFLSYLASFISPAYQIPINYSSLKKTLTQQIDFTFEMKNLNIFSHQFKQRRDVKFPSPYAQNTKDMVLIESFVEGLPVTYYEFNRHPLNKVIARLGSEIFFEMLMKNNFIHADCHGGNIFVQLKQQSYNFFTEIRDIIKDLYEILGYRLKAQTVDSQTLKKLYLQYCQEEMQVRKLMRRQKQKIIINLLDAGMVIKLQEKDKQNFVKFIKFVIQGKGQESAMMIYNLSKYQGEKLKGDPKFDNYRKQLLNVFCTLNTSHYSELNGVGLFHEMLGTIRRNKMKLQGQFATLLTNILVLQGIGREIDPSINILTCAFPYFKYVEDVSL